MEPTRAPAPSRVCHGGCQAGQCHGWSQGKPLGGHAQAAKTLGDHASNSSELVAAHKDIANFKSELRPLSQAIAARMSLALILD